MSEVKVNKISPRSGTTVTLGDSGDTFTIPSGATINNQGTATNFGATGSASWTTTVKTGDFTAVAGEGYFVNTTSGEIDVALPAGTAGAVVAVKDYAKTWDTNNCILVPNGSDKIGGSTNSATLSTEGLAVTLIFIDSTQGWLVTDDGLQSVAVTNPFMEATGGTVTCSGNDKIHTFTGPGTFCVSKIASCAANNQVSYVVVGGGGGAGGGGAGAGGFREDKSPTTPYTSSPLEGAGPITVTATAFPITVGAAGTVGSPDTRQSPGGNGGVSTFSTITSAGGGFGGGGGQIPGAGQPSTPVSEAAGGPGGSGGGSGASNQGGTTTSGGTGNTPPVSPPQGQTGGPGKWQPGSYGATGGGGGAGGVGQPFNCGEGVTGGAGVASSITASPVTYAAGGPAPATANSGNGGRVSAGNSGVVIIRYKFQ
jgi:hypothetical protein